MKLIDTTCPYCGAKMKVDTEKKHIVCEYCGSTLIMEEEKTVSSEDRGYQYEMGRQKAREDYKQQKQREAQQAARRKKFIWLWVLGWIYFFPIPLTILLVRNKNMNPTLKKVIIAIMWGLVGILTIGTMIAGVIGAKEEGTATTESTVQSTTRNRADENITEIHFADQKDVTVKIGEKTNEGKVNVTLKNSFSYSSDDVQLISDDPGIATITLIKTLYGKTVYYTIEGISAGETYVYAASKDGSVTSEKITVIVPSPIEVENISIEIPNETLVLGETVQVATTVTPDNADNQEIAWSSSDVAVASIDDKGIITAISEGSATIIAKTANGVSSSLEVNVDGSKRVMRLRVTHSREDDNNIGDEWSYEIELNSDKIPKEMIISAGEKLTCHARFIESDNNPDIGEESKTYTVTKDDILNGFTISMDVYVKENGGKNSGKSAHFVVTYTFTER